ncbi:MAG TPA: substrate-binding domain-containing protein [Streptosporangiaceae bacterium]|jgi:hypothetical protein
MTSRRAARSSRPRRGRRRVRPWALVTLAVVIAAGFVAARTAQALITHGTCRDRPVRLNVAVTADLAPAVSKVAAVFNQQRHQVTGHCAQVMIIPGQPAAQAAQLSGQPAAGRGQPGIAAWIPDSSLWVDAARSSPAGARTVRPTGVGVALSPLMIVMPARAAASVPAFGPSVGWSFLLPPSVGGPAASLGIRVDLPDPSQSAAGLATLVQVGRLLGASGPARTSFTKFVFSTEVTSSFDDPAALSALTRLAEPPLNGRPVTVASEQAVIRYDQSSPRQPLAARYPSSASEQLGSPVLNYPYVLTSTNPVQLQVARLFENALQQPYAAAVVRFDGFRSASGETDAVPRAFGLNTQPLQLAAPATAAEVSSTRSAWQRLAIGSRDLALVDVSDAMQRPAGFGGLTLEQELSQTAGLGLALFPDSTALGLWQAATRLPGGKEYQQLAPVQPLPAEVGLVSHRQQLQQILQQLRPRQGSGLALHDAILAAYRHMVSSYQPRDVNAVLVLTSGVDSDSHDLPLASLLSRIRALQSPRKRVEIVAIMFGRAGDYAALRQISEATGGSAYQISNPQQIGKVFFKAVANRLCEPDCATP